MRANQGDLFTPANLFEEHAGHFWGILGTRVYMRARYALVQALLEVKTYAAVEAAHGHLMDMLRLCRSDNMGVRDLIPAVKMRLGRDQECYDFCKWWAIVNEDSHYNWGDLSIPFLDIKNANCFESPRRYFIKEFGSLSHTAAILLLKIRLLKDVRDLQNSSIIGENVLQELLDDLRRDLVSGSIVAENKDIMNARDCTRFIWDLEEQVELLYLAVEDLNENFLPALLDPAQHMTARPEAYSHGSLEEAQIVLQSSLDAWQETPGAIEHMREVMGEGPEV